MFEFDRRIISGKAPIDGDLPFIASGRPGGNLLLCLFKGGEPLRQALAIQRREFNLGHIEPTRMLGGVMHLKALAESTRLGSGKDFIEGRKRVRIEIVQHQDDLVGSRIVLLSQLADKLSPFLFGPLHRRHGHARADQWFAGQKHVTAY